MRSRALARRFSGRSFAPRSPLGPRGGMRVGDDEIDPSVAIPDPSDGELENIGINPDQLVSPQDRAAAVAAFNQARTAMAAAKNGKQIDAMAAWGGEICAAGALAFPPIAAIGALWAGSLQALKALGNWLGWATEGLGTWTEWLNNYPPQGTNAQDGDANWFDPASGYKPGAHTPYTVHDSHYMGYQPATFGDIRVRIARADMAGPAFGAFARFVLPLVYRAYELGMNGRLRDENGLGLSAPPVNPDPSSLFILDSDFTAPYCSKGNGKSGFDPAFRCLETKDGPGRQVFNDALAAWNSQHYGPPQDVSGDDFPFAPDTITVNQGALKSNILIGLGGRISRVPTTVIDLRGAQAIAACAPWLAYYRIT